MVRDIHDGEVISVQELQSSTSQSKVSKHDELTRRRPEQVIERLSLELLQQSRRLPRVHLVETDADVGCVSMDDRELGSNRLPSKRLNWFFNFYRVDRNLLLPHMEYFKVVVHSGVFDVIFVLLDFRVTVYFDAEVVAALLPVDLTVGDGEQILGTYFGAVGEFQERYPRGHVFVLRHPIRYNVICRRPAKVSVGDKNNQLIHDLNKYLFKSLELRKY